MHLQSSTATAPPTVTTDRNSNVKHIGSSKCSEAAEIVDWTSSTSQGATEATKSSSSISMDSSLMTTMSSLSQECSSSSSSQEDLLFLKEQNGDNRSGTKADSARANEEVCSGNSMALMTPSQAGDASEGEGQRQEKQQEKIETKLPSSPMSTPKRNSRKRHDIFRSVVDEDGDDDIGRFQGSSGFLGGSQGRLTLISPVSKTKQSTGRGVRNVLASPIGQRDIRTGITYFGESLGDDSESMMFTDIAISSERGEDDDGNIMLSSPRRSPRSKSQSSSPTSILGFDRLLQAAKETIPSLSTTKENNTAASPNNVLDGYTDSSCHDDQNETSTRQPEASSVTTSFSLGSILRKSWTNNQNQQEQIQQDEEEEQQEQPQRHSMSWWVSKQDRKTLAQRVSEDLCKANTNSVAAKQEQ